MLERSKPPHAPPRRGGKAGASGGVYGDPLGALDPLFADPKTEVAEGVHRILFLSYGNVRDYAALGSDLFGLKTQIES
ncbi:hypothetical protein [Allomeiothermus silvanus]|nr:hypothetical protein [Allomeiothermus silvanus]